MKTTLLTLFALVSSFLANSQKFPSESPKASLVQQVGLSDIKISYSRPNVRKRKVFGTLVPYGEVWRTGANYPTKIEFSDTTLIQGKHKLSPGIYALYTIPYPDRWIIIFSNNTDLWGSYGYQESDDALRIEVKPDTNAVFYESFTVQFSDLGLEKSRIQMNWEKTEVSFEVNVDIYDRVIAYINDKIIAKDTTNYKWRYYWQGADFLLKKDTSLELALRWIAESIKMKELWFNYWTGAELNAKLGDYEKAIEMGVRALEIGEAPENKVYFPYSEVYKNQISLWKSELSE